MNEKLTQQTEDLMQIRKDLYAQIGNKGFSITPEDSFTRYPEILSSWGERQRNYRDYIEGDVTYFVAKGITTIRNYAFYGCTSLTSADLTGIEKIENCAFQDCGDNFKKIWIPKTCTTIGGTYTFLECRQLTIYTEFESKPSGWSSLYKYFYWGSPYSHEPRWGSTYEEFLNA